MTMTPPKAISLILLAVFSTLLISFPAWAGVIRTTVTSSSRVTDSGDIKLTMDIRNLGDVTADKVSVSLLLGDLVRRYPDLGKNPPGGKIHLKDLIPNSGWLPGKYGCVVTVNFEDQNGKPHVARHFFSVRYLIKSPESASTSLRLKTVPPVFNKRAFWVKEENLRLTMENHGNETVRPALRLFVPEGFDASQAVTQYNLAPGGEKTFDIPVRYEGEGKNLNPFHLLVAYDLEGRHHSQFLKGNIRVEERPVFFKWYILLGAVALVIACIALLIRKPRIS